MSKERELLEKIFILYRGFSNCSKMTVLLNECKELLAQPEQEPVAWIYDWLDWCEFPSILNRITHIKAMIEQPEAFNVRPLYTSPPTREPLSKEQYMKFFTDTYDSVNPITDFVRAIEAAHGIGVDNNGN